MRRYMADEIDVTEYLRLIQADVDADLEPMFARMRTAHDAQLHFAAVFFLALGVALGVVVGFLLGAWLV